MSGEFRTVKPNTATSTRGFTVQWVPHGEIVYEDASGRLRIDSELLIKALPDPRLRQL